MRSSGVRETGWCACTACGSWGAHPPPRTQDRHPSRLWSGTRQHVSSRPLVTPFGSRPHTKTSNFVGGTAEGAVASELDSSSALANSMLPRGLRHHSRSGGEGALTAASLVKRGSLAVSPHLSCASPRRDKASEQRRDVH